MNIREARIRAGLNQTQMAKLFDIPLRNVQRWEAETVKPPVWAEKLILQQLERIGDILEQNLMKTTYFLGALFGYLDRQFEEQTGRSPVTPVFRDNAFREPVTYTMNLLKQAHQRHLKLDEDLITMIINQIEVSTDKENYGYSPLFGKKFLVEEQGNFSVGNVKGKALIYSPIYKAFQATKRNLYALATEYNLDTSILIAVITGHTKIDSLSIEEAEKFAKAVNMNLADFTNLKFVNPTTK